MTKDEHLEAGNAAYTKIREKNLAEFTAEFQAQGYGAGQAKEFAEQKADREEAEAIASE